MHIWEKRRETDERSGEKREPVLNENLVEKEAWATRRMRTVLTHVLHVLSKGLRVAVQSGSIQWCTRTIRGVWVLASQNARLRSRAQWGGYHTETKIHGNRWKPREKYVLKFQKKFKKMRELRGWCFIATQNFKLKHIMRCELWKRQN